MEKIRIASKQDIPSLCKIWKQCFSDSEDYINLFYEKNFERIKAVAYYENEKPVSVIHLVDAVLTNGSTNQKAWLVYATGTLETQRKKGCMSALIRYVTDMADKNGLALFLKPSSPATAQFYKSFGFEEGAKLSFSSVSPSETQAFEFREISFSEYNEMREKAFCNIPHAVWDNPHIKWCIEENEYFSGKTLGIKIDGKEHFLLAYPEKNSLIINETDLSLKQLKEAGAFLCGVFSTEHIEAYLPPSSFEKEEKSFSLLLYNSKINNPYINLIMI